MEERKKVEIKLDISAVSNKCMIHIQEITNCLTLIHQAINHSNIDIIKLLPTNSLPIHIETLMPKPTIEEQKEIAINWILTKAFEEFVNGLTKGLKEAYRSLKFYEFALKPNDSLSEEDIISEIQNINKASEKAHFPELIITIEKNLNVKHFLREEILSINKIRKCLVHRDGIVSEKDIEESSADDELILKWLSTKTITQIDNKEIELNYESRRVGVSVPFVGIKQSYMQRKFKIKDKISFDINDFNDISYTCISFVQELYNVMPKNDISTNNPV